MSGPGNVSPGWRLRYLRLPLVADCLIASLTSHYHPAHMAHKLFVDFSGRGEFLGHKYCWRKEEGGATKEVGEGGEGGREGREGGG